MLITFLSLWVAVNLLLAGLLILHRVIIPSVRYSGQQARTLTRAELTILTWWFGADAKAAPTQGVSCSQRDP